MHELELIQTQESLPLQQAYPLLRPSVSEHTKQEVFQVVLRSLAKSFADLGKSDLSKEDQQYLANELTNNIMTDYQALRLHEIPIAFAKGIRREYGEYYGLNVVSFEGFIKGYLNSEERKEQVRDLSKLRELEMPVEPSSQEEEFCRGKKMVLKELHTKQNGGNPSMLAWVVYNFLERLQLISYTDEEYQSLSKEAHQTLLAELSRRADLERNVFKRMDIRHHLSAMRAQCGETVLLVDKVKELVLNRFLTKCISEGINLEALMESKKAVFVSCDGENNTLQKSYRSFCETA